MPSSRINNLPGPQVGRAAREQKILPPVFSSAATAELSVDKRAGSGFLTVENICGSRLRSEVMTDLDSYGSTKRPSLSGTKGSSMSGMIIICACSSAGLTL